VASVSAREEGWAEDQSWEATRLPEPYRTTESFIGALRRDDPRALQQLFLFYTPLLRDEARRMGVGTGDRQELVTTLLDDVVMRLQRSNKLPHDFMC
jgi:hypothetical protein